MEISRTYSAGYIPAMAGHVTIHETDDSREQSEHTNDAGYLVEVDGTPFLFLYLTPSNYSIAWDGRLDFERLPQELLVYLARTLDGGAIMLFKRLFWEIDARYVLAGESNDILVKQTGDVRDILKKYRDLDARSIAFLRYDVWRGRGFVYGVSAANPAYSPADPELAIEFPRREGFSGSVLEWILGRHLDKRATYVDRYSLLMSLQRTIADALPRRKG